MNTLSAIICSDGLTIQSTRFEPSTPSRANLLIASATGVPQWFYRRFAQFACEQGFSAMTVDYRGIGLSAPPNLRGFQADFLDWARLDLTASLQTLHDPTKPTYMIGHSFGGTALGLMPNHKLVTKMCALGTGAGWTGYMPTIEGIKVSTMWNLIGPITTFALGYLPGKALGLGENIPMGVYRQWRRWATLRSYFFDDPSTQDALTEFANVTAPIRAVSSLDDLWALPASRDAFFKGYKAAPIELVTLDPKKLGMPIGHMGYFRSGREALWEDALQWFEAP